MSDYNKFYLDRIARLTEACAEKDKRITELCAENRRFCEMSSADPRIDAFLEETFNLLDRLQEARRLIERIGTIGVERIDTIHAAEKWLDDKP